MPLPPANQPIAESDYDAIEAAVMETARGRWFLAQYADRNRHADTRLVLDAIQRLQRSVLGAEIPPPPAQAMPAIRAELSGVERTIEDTKRALSEIHANHRRDGDLGHELSDIIEASAQAISEVLSDADRIGEISTTMRAQGIAEHVCDQLDGLSTHINTACAFQDLTGQRMQKVANALRALETNVQSLVKLWQAESAEQAPAKNDLVNGPAREGEGLMQDQIDELLSIDQNHDVFWEEKTAASAPAAAPAQTQTAPQTATPPAKPVARNDLEKLTPEERVALFS